VANTSLISTAINLLVSPSEAFTVIKERPSPFFPLILILVGLVCVWNLYINQVDVAWFIEEQLRASPQGAEMSEAQIQEAVGFSSASPAIIGVIGSITSSILVTILYLIYALYLWGISSAAKHGLKYGQALGLTCWCALPSVLGMLASIVNLLVNDVALMPQHLINPLSYGALLGVDGPPEGVAQQIMLNFDVTFIWTALLLVLGYQAWTGKSLGVAAGVALAPYVLLIGLGIVSAAS
jgi:hypothetical protein